MITETTSNDVLRKYSIRSISKLNSFDVSKTLEKLINLNRLEIYLMSFFLFFI